MNERIAQELRLLRTRYPDLEYHEDSKWILLPRFPLPSGVWQRASCDVAFQVPVGYPGQKPYGFCVSPPIALANGQAVQNRTDTSELPFPGTWSKFSWDPPEWRATADLQSGDNLLNWVLTFEYRLREGA